MSDHEVPVASLQTETHGLAEGYIDPTTNQTVGDTLVVTDEHLDSQQILSGFETQHFVKPAPTLAELSDQGAGRSASLNVVLNNEHLHSDPDRDAMGYDRVETTSEGEAIQETVRFFDQLEADIMAVSLDDSLLTDVVAELTQHDPSHEDSQLHGHKNDNMDVPQEGTAIKAWLADKVAALRETSFLGESEAKEASLGLALYWKDYLSQDPDHQIVMLGIDRGKSSAYMLESVLEQYDDADMAGLQGRIVWRIDQVTSPKEKVKIVVLDDWLMSGDQIQQRLEGKGVERFADGDKLGTDDIDLDLELGKIFSEQSDAGDTPASPVETSVESSVKEVVEVNAFMADARRLSSGFNYNTTLKDIPVKAFFAAPDAIDSADGAMSERYFSRITGLHSTADHHFAYTIHNVITIMNRINEAAGTGQPPYEMPPLTNILRSYRQLDAPQTAKLFAEAA